MCAWRHAGALATPRRIIGTYYALTGMFNLSASLIWGINTLFLLDAGLSIFHAFAANAAFTAGQVLFEIPTGVVADTRGRRFSFLLSAATLLVGTVAYVSLAAIGAAFIWWVVASVVLGLGFTFYSGAVEAWFVDALAAAGVPTDLDPYFARAAQVFGAAMLVGTVGGGLLGQVHLSLPYLARSLLLLGLFAVGYLLMHDDGFDRRAFHLRHVPREVASVATAGWQHGWRNPSVRLLMMMSFIQMGFLMWGWYAWQPHFLELLGRELIWVAGVIAALVALVMILGNQLVRVLHGRLPRPVLLIGASMGLSVCILGVGLVDSFYPAVGLFLLAMVFFGVIGPAKQAAMHKIIPSQQRATIISLDGLLGSAGGIGSQLALARLAEDRCYAVAYAVGGAVLALAVPLAFAFRQRVPRIGTPPVGASAAPDSSYFAEAPKPTAKRPES
jgi:MFS family permease